ncbi:MAG TPA: hypothetical protein VNO79_10625 [Actinomycetota bacterium]|nr:hypothetical protein [Actinomycetota bacterium]
MNVPTLEMAKERAREELGKYREALRVRRSEEDEVIAAAYRELARGRNLLDLQAAFAAGGLDERGLPRIALARADAQWCYLGWRISWEGDRPEIERFLFGSGDRPLLMRSSTRVAAWKQVPAGTPVPAGGQGRLRTQVPVVPPPLRPRGSLSWYHVLFEVERWEMAPPPPRDPILLRRIRGDLFAVVATWDLTEVERMVLATRS